MDILRVENLVKRYSGRTVADNVSFRIGEREIVGLMGRNGAGKTTSFRMAMGMVTPDAGQVFFKGKNVTRLPMYKRARLGMGYLAQERSVFMRLSVLENLMVVLDTTQNTKAGRLAVAEKLMAQFDLTKNRNQAARTLSGGERRKLEIARALVTHPSLILLDEPFAGVDPVAKDELQSEIRRLRDEQNLAILITDHDPHQTFRACDRVYIINKGCVLREGSPRELAKDQEVIDVYLASTFKHHGFE